MKPWLMIASLILGLTCCIGCLNFEPMTTEKVEQIFVSKADVEIENDVAPPTVPVLQSTELGGWRMLCNECHIGPNFSSHTILNWGHRATCLAEISCFQCHGEDLHRMDVRGNKQLCYDCHISKGVPVKCKTCHTQEHIAKQPQHEASFLGKHGSHVTEEQSSCFQCHGSERWCMACHGLPMPHPADIIKVHPKLVQGQPQVCGNCHGSQSCIRCHLAKGVKAVAP